MNIIRKARGTEIPNYLSRIFLCYDRSDCTGRDAVISDLLSWDAGKDCVISCLETSSDINEEDLRIELSETKLLVIWITPEMLKITTKIPTEYSIAKELSVPILPILNDDGLFELYTDKFGSIHCITRLNDKYRDKLKAQMDEFFVSDIIIKQVKEKAFTSAVFLSYRRKDLPEVRHFMKLFHDLKGLESISINYDDFLRAGDKFDDAIKKLIHDSVALIIIVTPRMATNKDNYVQKYEYPFARSINKEIIPVETVQTSQSLLTKYFPDIGSPIPLENIDAIQRVFHNKLHDSILTENLDSEHAYLLGMAYLNEINVERDFNRAVKLFTLATGDNTQASIDAANQLASIYENGTGTNIDLTKALYWYERALVIGEKVFGKEHSISVTASNNVAEIYSNQGDYHKALEWYMKAVAISEKLLGKEHRDTASTYNNIAGIYSNQGDYHKALEWYKKASVISENILGKEHPDTAITYNNIAVVYYSKGNYPKALEWYQKALIIYEKVLGKEAPVTSATYNNIAVVYESQGNYSMALEWYNKALAIREKIFIKEHPDTARTYNNIAGIYNSQGNYQEALKWYNKSLSINEKVLGKEHPDTATTYNNIALIYNNQGDYTKVMEWYNKALTIREKVFGAEHPNTATTINNIALFYHSKGDYSMALEWYNRALVIREKILGKEHPDTASIYNNIALIYSNQGYYPKAMEWYNRALSIREKILGKEHPDTATTYNNIAVVYYIQGDYLKALEWYQKALIIREKILGEEHPDTATTYNNIAVIYDTQGNYSKALEYYQKVLTISEKVLGKEHPDTATVYNNIAVVYYNQKEYQKALEYYQKDLKISEKVLGKEHPDTATTYNNMAGIYYKQNECPKALEWYQKALTIREKVLGKEHPDIADSYNNIALVYNAQGNYQKALESYQIALNISEKILGKEHIETAITYNNIALTYNHQNEYPKALEWYRKALTIFEKVLGKEHPNTVTIYNNIALVYQNQKKYFEALEWYQKSYKISEKILGKEHPDTFDIHNNIVEIEKDSLLENLRQNVNLIKRELEFNKDNLDSHDLCHYTKLSTLPFLLKSENIKDDIDMPKFRISNSAYMNDPSEGQTLFKRLECADLFNELKYMEISLSKVYIASFSLDKDNLVMWVHYGDNGNGCCAVFSKDFFYSEKNPDSSSGLSTRQEIKLYKVYYCNEIDTNNDEVSKLLNIISESIKKNRNQIIKDEHLNHEVYSILNEISFFVKNDAYMHEKEVRLILTADDIGNIPFLDRKGSEPKLYMNINNIIKFKEIVLGPKVSHNSDIIPFLSSAEVEKITFSNVPYK